MKQDINLKIKIMEITLKQAQAVLKSAAEKAASLNVPVNITILDTAGHLKAFERMDDAFLGSLDIAFKKAKTASLFRMNSEQVGEFLKPESKAYGITGTNEGLVGFGGGMPIHHNNSIIGYIGVSGGAIEQDVAIAQAGAATNEL